MINLMIMNFAKQYGGVEKHIEDFIQNVQRDKYKIHIVCRENSKFHESILEKFSGFNNVIIIPLRVSKVNLIFSIIQLRNYIKEERIIIIHSHGITSNMIALLSKKNNTRLINTIHGYSDYDRLERSSLERAIFNFLEKMLCKKNDLCIAVSEDIKRYLIEKGINEQKIKVVYHGIEMDGESLPKVKKSKDFYVVSSLGRLEKVKGYNTLIKSIKYCVSEGYVNILCKIAGDGKDREELLDLITQLDINKYCVLTGYINDKQKFLDESDIYVQPSLIESFGIAILEAMRAGIPVIATNSGGIKEIIIDEKDGLLFEPEDFKALGNKIIELINDMDKRNKITNNAMLKVRENFDIHNMVSNIENIIDQLTQ